MQRAMLRVMFKSLLIWCILIAPSGIAATSEERQQKVMDMVISEAIKVDFPPALALAIAQVGSDFEPEAVNHSGARGVMQLMPKMAYELYDVPAYRLFDARTNIITGLNYFNQLLVSYDDYVDIALSAYHGGAGVETANGLAIMPATQHYVSQVIAQRQYYIKHPKVQVALDGVNPPVDFDKAYADNESDPLVRPNDQLQLSVTEERPMGPTRRDNDLLSMPVADVPEVPRKSRRQRQKPVNINALDDFSDGSSLLNQMLVRRKSARDETGQQSIEEQNNDKDLLDNLSPQRQALVSNLRALRRYNLKR
jgi:hypothetical protein